MNQPLASSRQPGMCISTIKGLRGSLLVLAIATVPFVAGCGTDSDSSASDPFDQEQWRATAKLVDDRFTSVDNSDDEFSVKQAGYEEIGGLLDTLIDNVDQVDASSRTEVEETIERAHELTDTFVAASDEAEAGEKLETFFSEGESVASPAAAKWILDTCGVDIDG